MEKLIKPVEYARKVGISRQAVYAKIKRGILQSKSVDGKLYIVMEEEVNMESPQQSEALSLGEDSQKAVSPTKKHPDYETLLRAKDETIHVLKETVGDLKESNRQMSSTLRGEIDLLKEAFHEMRSLYIAQIEQIRKPESEHIQKAIEVPAVEQKPKWISIKKFFKKHNIDKSKKQKSAMKKFKKAYKKGDLRILEEEGEIKLRKKERFEDILG